MATHVLWEHETVGSSPTSPTSPRPAKGGSSSWLRGTARDSLLLYAGIDVYHALVEVAGWSHDEWAAWTMATLAHQLFAVEIDGP